jgi:hypothetical protein
VSADLQAGIPDKLRLVAGGTLTLAITAPVSILNSAQLPDDGKYDLLLRLMWQGNLDWIPVVLSIFWALQAFLVAWGVGLILVGIKGDGLQSQRRLVYRLWPYTRHCRSTASANSQFASVRTGRAE